MLLKLAARSARRNPRRTGLTCAVMIVGFVLFSLSLALVDGTYGDIIELFTGEYTGHARLSQKEFPDNPSLYRTVPQFSERLKMLSADSRVRSLAPRIHSGGLGFYQNKNFALEIVGIDPNLEEESTHYQRRVLSGRAFSVEDQGKRVALLGKTAAKVLGIELGKELIVISQGADGSIANDLFQVVGIIGSDQESKDDTRLYLPLEIAQEFFALYDQVHEIAVHLKDIRDSRSFAKEYSEKLKQDDLVVQPWQVVEVDFYKAMVMDKKGNQVTLFIIMLMVGMSILNSILMSTLERTREFGIIKALGTLPRQVFSLILSESVFLALLSVLVGSILAFGLNLYFTIEGITYPEPIKFAGVIVSTLNAEMNLSSFLIPTIVVILTSIIAALYPAYRAAKISVSDALRDF